tara:strand:+ start:149 stop:643 length:495 start_codon:yes stop_codon:yes gene_type:complete
MANETVPTEAIDAAIAAESSSSSVDVAGYADQALDTLITYAPQLVAAFLIFVIGKWIAGLIRNGVKKTMTKRNVDPALISFGSSMLYYALVIAVVIAHGLTKPTTGAYSSISRKTSSNAWTRKASPYHSLNRMYGCIRSAASKPRPIPTISFQRSLGVTSEAFS